MDCIFCKIASKAIPSAIVYEDEKCLIFKDIHPAAPIHLLAIPKAHCESALDINDTNADVIGHIFAVIAKESAALGLKYYRVVTNCGEDAGQTVLHLHFHVLGGRELSMIMG